MADKEENTVDAKPTEENANTATQAPPKPKKEKIEKPKPAEKNEEIKVEQQNENVFDPSKLGILNDVAIALTIEVGRAQIKIRDLLNLTKGSIIELNKSAGDPVDIYANGKLISTGNIITANGRYCVRLTSIPESSKLGVDSDGN